jgi:hypothetical protein
VGVYLISERTMTGAVGGLPYPQVMSEETKGAVEQAAEQLERSKIAADKSKNELLAVIAADIPTRVEDIAKKAVFAQVEVSKALGKEGIATLRAKLLQRSTEIAGEVSGATERVSWPVSYSDASTLVSTQIARSTFTLLSGYTKSLNRIFKDHGYVNPGSGFHELVSEHNLVDETARASEFDAATKALNALAADQRALKAARAADDQNIVDSLWGEG